MINLYQPPTKDNPTVGFTFMVFSQESFGMHYHKYSNLETAIYNFKEVKLDCIVMNLESFHRFSSECCDGQIEKESIQAIRSCVNKWLEHKFNYPEFLEDVIKKANFMRALVQAMPPDKAKAGIMMAATIMKFCKAELADEYKENKG